MAIPSMFNASLTNNLPGLNEQARNAIIREAAQQGADIAEGGTGREGDQGTPAGILRDPWVQRGLALIIGAFVGGGVAYLVFGGKD